MKKLNIFYVIIILVFLIQSCSDNTNTPSDDSKWYEKEKFDVEWYDDYYKYDVEYTENTVYFDSTNLNALIEFDLENQIYTFDYSNELVKKLQTGSIFLLHGKALRKVTDMNISGNKLIVKTEDALLVEAIENGTIEWDAGIDFSNPSEWMVSNGKNTEILTPVDGSKFEYKQKFGDYEYTLELEFLGDVSKVKCIVEKTIGGVAKGKFEFEGMISKFRSKNKMEIKNRKIEKIDYLNDALNGALTVSLTVAASGDDMIKLFELPVTLLKIPLSLPIPTTIDLKVVFDIRGSVPLGGSSRVSANFKYNSSTGFKYDGIDVSVNGKAGTHEIKDNVTETGAPGAIAANFGFGFPRIALNMANELIMPWVHTAFIVGGAYTTFPACQKADASFVGAVGIDINVTKAIKISGSYTLWNLNKELLRSGDCD